MKKRYQWMEISEDGLLRLPEDQGPYWDSYSINAEYDYYKNEEDAIAGAEKFFKRCGGFNPFGRLTLVTIYMKD